MDIYDMDSFAEFRAEMFTALYLISLVWFGFYGTSTIVSYSMPNPVFYIYIKYIIRKHIF